MKQDIEFKSKGVTCRGWLFTPDAGKPPFPCVITAMGGGYVKEFPIMGRHAEEFMHHGLASIVYDNRYFGASEGLPRQHIDPMEQVEDCRNAISLAETLPNVDPERLGFFGISLGGAHALVVAALDSRIKCTVACVAYVDGYNFQRLIRGEKRFKQFCEVILEDRRKRFKDETQRGYLPSYSPEPEKDLCQMQNAEHYEVFAMSYKKVAPAWENRRTIEGAELQMNYQVLPYMSRIISMPILFVSIEGDTMYPYQIEAYNRVPSPHKKCFILPSKGGKVNHLSIYRDPSYMQIIAEQAAEFLAEHLVRPYKK